MMDSVIFQKGLDYQEFLRSDLYPRPAGAVQATFQVDAKKVTLEFVPEDNCQYVVVVTPDVKSLTGATLSDLFVYYFTSVCSPAYCSLSDVLSVVGSLGEYFTPRMVYMAIRDASLFADQITKQTTKRTSITYNLKQYVRYRAAYILLAQVFLKRVERSGESKQLDDFQISYSRSPAFDELVRYVQEQMNKWEKTLVVRAAPRTVVKGGNVVAQPVTPRSF